MYWKKKQTTEDSCCWNEIVRVTYFYFSVCELVEQSVSWCFEPSQPQRITSGLKLVEHDMLKLVEHDMGKTYTFTVLNYTGNRIHGTILMVVVVVNNNNNGSSTICSLATGHRLFFCLHVLLDLHMIIIPLHICCGRCLLCVLLIS